MGREWGEVVGRFVAGGEKAYLGAKARCFSWSMRPEAEASGYPIWGAKGGNLE